MKFGHNEMHLKHQEYDQGGSINSKDLKNEKVFHLGNKRMVLSATCRERVGKS